MLAKINPNWLTSMRLILVIPAMYLLLHQAVWSFAACIAVMIIIEVTDFLDGYIARKYGKVTDVGKIYDPACDAIYHSIIFICLIQYGLSIWLVAILVAREIAMSYVRIYSIMKGFVLAARPSGKLKANFQMASQFAFVLSLMILAYSCWWMLIVLIFADAVLAFILFKKKSRFAIILPVSILLLLSFCLILQPVRAFTFSSLVFVTLAGAVILTVYSFIEYIYFLKKGLIKITSTLTVPLE